MLTSTGHKASRYVVFCTPVTSCLLGPNIFLGTLFSNTLTQYQRPSFTPTQNRKNYRSMCLNIYICRIENCSTKYSAPKGSKHFLTSICPSNISYIFFMAQQLLLDQDLLIAHNSRSLTDTPRSAGSL
jgi:hypothetical protein